MQQYNENYFQQDWVEKNEATLRRYLELLPSTLEKSVSLLDVGCGSGRFVKVLKKEGYITTFGVDIALPALSVGKKEKLDLLLASMEKGLPFQSETFDAVFFLDVIEHLQRPYEALLELQRVIKKDGLLLITTPNAGSVLRKLQGKHWYALKDTTHLYYFNMFGLLYLLSKSGFTIEKHFTYSGLNIPALNLVLEKTKQGGQLVVLARKVV